MRRALRRALLLALATIALPAAAARAHPLDDYVQATYITLGADRVTLELVLTPGVEIAGRVLAMIDADGDRAVSEEEARRYAESVLGELSLEIDGRPVRLTLLGAEFPPVSGFLTGHAPIRLRLAAAGRSGRGEHRLAFRNGHQPLPSAYLVNAYVPPAPFTITSQTRDSLQRGIELDYAVAPGVGLGLIPLALLLSALATGALLMRRKRIREGRSRSDHAPR